MDDDLSQVLDKILSLEVKSAEHRQDLLDKYSEILIKSEGRVDNINKMIGNLMQMTKDFGEQSNQCRQLVFKMTELVENKERRLQRLEERYDDLNDRYNALLQRYFQLAETAHHPSLSINQNNKPL